MDYDLSILRADHAELFTQAVGLPFMTKSALNKLYAVYATLSQVDESDWSSIDLQRIGDETA